MSNRRPMSPQRIHAMREHILAHWGQRPVMEIAELAGESYGAISLQAARMGMPRLGSKLGHAATNEARAIAAAMRPNATPAARLEWAREHAPTDKEAAMVLAMSGKDVRAMGWR